MPTRRPASLFEMTQISMMLKHLEGFVAEAAGRSAIDFARTPGFQKALAFDLEQAGEAVAKLMEMSSTVVTTEMKDLKKFRVRIAHHYGDVDPREVWNFVEKKKASRLVAYIRRNFPEVTPESIPIWRKEPPALAPGDTTVPIEIRSHPGWAKHVEAIQKEAADDALRAWVISLPWKADDHLGVAKFFERRPAGINGLAIALRMAHLHAAAMKRTR